MRESRADIRPVHRPARSGEGERPAPNAQHRTPNGRDDAPLRRRTSNVRRSVFAASGARFLQLLAGLALFCRPLSLGAGDAARQDEVAPRPGPAVPVPRAELEDAIRRGVDFLLRVQNPDGSWGSARRTKGLNIYAPAPGAHRSYRAATTALCLAAMIETGDSRESVQQAIDRCESWMLEQLPVVRRTSPEVIYCVWAHGYGVRALVRMHGRSTATPERKEAICRLIAEQVDLLGRYEAAAGGWGYLNFDIKTQKPGCRAASFMTATVLIALHEAAQLGVEIPAAMVERAKAAVLRQRKPDSSYLYGGNHWLYPMYRINRPAGSLGRSQVCNAALKLWGHEQITDRVLTAWLDRLFARGLWMDIARKRPVPHESWFAVAGYFFYYGYFYAGHCIEFLESGGRAPYQDHLARVLLPLQEKDGSWWDYPLYDYHQQYGTAYALMSLVRCRKAGPGR